MERIIDFAQLFGGGDPDKFRWEEALHDLLKDTNLEVLRQTIAKLGPNKTISKEGEPVCHPLILALFDEMKDQLELLVARVALAKQLYISGVPVGQKEAQA